MRDNSYDRTIERNYLQKWRFLIPEYEAVKASRSEAFERVGMAVVVEVIWAEREPESFCGRG